MSKKSCTFSYGAYTMIIGQDILDIQYNKIGNKVNLKSHYLCVLYVQKACQFLYRTSDMKITYIIRLETRWIKDLLFIYFIYVYCRFKKYVNFYIELILWKDNNLKIRSRERLNKTGTYKSIDILCIPPK